VRRLRNLSEAILSTDGQKILNFGRQSIPTFVCHGPISDPSAWWASDCRLAVGAKAAAPGAQVICPHGDGSFGHNAMELYTAVRHKPSLLYRLEWRLSSKYGKRSLSICRRSRKTRMTTIG
jgi:hypothetical protein